MRAVIFSDACWAQSLELGHLHDSLPDPDSVLDVGLDFQAHSLVGRRPDLSAASAFQAQKTVAELQAQLDLLNANGDAAPAETEDVAQLKVPRRTPRPTTWTSP